MYYILPTTSSITRVHNVTTSSSSSSKVSHSNTHTWIFQDRFICMQRNIALNFKMSLCL